MPHLENKIAVITGVTGGIGLATARLFADEGARVVLVDLNRDALAAAVTEIGADRATGWVADVSDPAAVPASDERSYCTGTTFPIDGGMSAS